MWTCASCTLKNQPSVLCCEACGGARGDNSSSASRSGAGGDDDVVILGDEGVEWKCHLLNVRQMAVILEGAPDRLSSAVINLTWLHWSGPRL